MVQILDLIGQFLIVEVLTMLFTPAAIGKPGRLMTIYNTSDTNFDIAYNTSDTNFDFPYNTSDIYVVKYCKKAPILLDPGAPMCRIVEENCVVNEPCNEPNVLKRFLATVPCPPRWIPSLLCSDDIKTNNISCEERGEILKTCFGPHSSYVYEMSCDLETKCKEWFINYTCEETFLKLKLFPDSCAVIHRKKAVRRVVTADGQTDSDVNKGGLEYDHTVLWTPETEAVLTTTENTPIVYVSSVYIIIPGVTTTLVIHVVLISYMWRKRRAEPKGRGNIKGRTKTDEPFCPEIVHLLPIPEHCILKSMNAQDQGKVIALMSPDLKDVPFADDSFEIEPSNEEAIIPEKVVNDKVMSINVDLSIAKTESTYNENAKTRQSSGSTSIDFENHEQVLQTTGNGSTEKEIKTSYNDDSDVGQLSELTQIDIRNRDKGSEPNIESNTEKEMDSEFKDNTSTKELSESTNHSTGNPARVLESSNETITGVKWSEDTKSEQNPKLTSKELIGQNISESTCGSNTEKEENSKHIEPFVESKNSTENFEHVLEPAREGSTENEEYSTCTDNSDTEPIVESKNGTKNSEHVLEPAREGSTEKEDYSTCTDDSDIEPCVESKNSTENSEQGLESEAYGNTEKEKHSKYGNNKISDNLFESNNSLDEEHLLVPKLLEV